MLFHIEGSIRKYHLCKRNRVARHSDYQQNYLATLCANKDLRGKNRFAQRTLKKPNSIVVF